MSSETGPRVARRGVEAREIIREQQRLGRRVGLIPTMGALHAGHLSLVEAARRDCDFTAATIFVNPTQFGPNEDFAKYPRTWDSDLEGLRQAGVDLVFAPEVDEMYPVGCTTSIVPPSVALPLEGRFRPGHFAGVATIVLKLFNLLPADLAYFGHKDYQQTLVVRHMAADLQVPTQVVVCPTVREVDGLAMSSRNRYLSSVERAQAVAVSRALRAADSAWRSGDRSGDSLRQRMADTLAAAGIVAIDYVSIAHLDTLAELDEVGDAAIALVACRIGATRLIDNWRLE